MAEITARQIQLIQKEAFRQIKEKAEAEVADARALLENINDRIAKL